MMKKQLLILLTLLVGVISYAQNTLVHYKVEGNLSPESGYDVGLAPDLTKSSGMGYNGGNTQLQTNDSNEYAELSINTIGRTNLTLSFYISIASGWGDWTVYTDNGTGGVVETQVGGINRLGFLVGNARTINIAIPDTALNKGLVKFRIQSSFGSFLGIQAGTNLRLDDIKILSGSPSIKVYSDANAFIQHLSPASILLNTDFGTVQTTAATAITKTFRVRNFKGEPTSQLNISNIEVSGVNAGDFSVSPTSISNIAVTDSDTGNSSTYKTFNISFLPQGDGIRTAEITLTSNAAPSPYTFTVIGVGASCTLVVSNYAENQMSFGGSPTLFAKHVNDDSPIVIGDLIGGTSCVPSPNIGRLYPSRNSWGKCVNDINLYNSPSQSLIVTGTPKEIEFGGPLGLDVSKQKNVSIQFNIAAFGKSRDRGVNSNAYITLSVLKPDGVTWSEEMKLLGSDTAGNYFNYAFGNGDVFTGSYDGNNLATQANNIDGGWFGTSYTFRAMKLDFPSVNLQRLKFRIKAYTPDDQGMWLIDDVRVVTSNSEYRTYRADGKWANSDNVVVTDPVEATKSFKNYKAIIKGNYTVPAQGLTICECEVEDGTTLNIPQNTVMAVRGNIFNKGDGTNFTVADGGNLLQVENGAINTGNITAQKEFTFTDGSVAANDRRQYNYVISPVVGQNIKTIYAGNPAVIAYNESTNYFVNSNGNYIPGKGFGVKEPTKAAVSASTVTANYVGVPYNGILNYPLEFTTGKTDANQGYNLVGNPYPSNLNIEALYDANTSKIGATFYFWDNRGNTEYAQLGSNYGGDNYAKYNAVADTGVGTGVKAPSVPGVGRVPNRYVKVGTGFLVQALKTAKGQTLDFNNTMRSADNSGPGFLGRSGQSQEKDRYWLTLKTPSDLEFMNAVVYLANGSKAFGPEDTETFGGSDDIFTIADEKKLAIQGRHLFTDTDEVELGMSLFRSGEHTISIYDKEGVFANGQSIYLKDREKGIITNLSEGSYTFTANAGQYSGRFQILYRPETTLATDAAVKDDVLVYRDGEDFVVKSKTKKITNVQVYDMNGRLIITLQPNNTKTIINATQLQHGMYILKISQGDMVTGRKIIK